MSTTELASTLQPTSILQPASTLQLESLTCPNCGAPTPLLGTQHVTCVYCGASIDVPAWVRAPILDFQLELLKLQQQEFTPYVDREQVLSNRLLVCAAIVVDVYLVAWWNTSVSSWSALDNPTRIIFLQLIVLPLGLIFLNWLLSDDNKHNFRVAQLDFAKLTFDLTAVAHVELVCSHCGAPLRPQETRDIVIRCAHCKTELLMPALLLNGQMTPAFNRAMAQRGKSYDRVAILKWVMIAATAVNGIGPLVLLEAAQDSSKQLLYLTGFTWSYFVNWLTTTWAYRQLGGGYALALFVTLLPLPAFFLFQMTRILAGLDPNSF